jgi:hypothetical protein
MNEEEGFDGEKSSEVCRDVQKVLTCYKVIFEGQRSVSDHPECGGFVMAS